MPHVIGTIKEYSLHAEIKNWYRETGDLVESKVDGYLIDIVRGDQLIEIQTGHFYAMRNKLSRLLTKHPVRVVYPIPILKWVSRYDKQESKLLGRRRSPKKGRIQSVFEELIYLQMHILHPNLAVEVLLIEQEDTLINDGKGSWRRGYWSVEDRKLISIYERRLFCNPNDYLSLLPHNLPVHFSSLEVSKLGGISLGLARKVLYAFTKMNLIKQICSQNSRKYYSFEV